MTAPLHTTITDGVAVVVLDSPHNRNSLGLLGIETLSAETERLGRDPAVDVIVLGHAGPAFSAGHDLREMQAADQAQLEELFHRSSALMQSLHALPQPVIARVDGVATAAGCQLVASCDLVMASDRSSFATPGVSIGLFCSTPMVALSRAIGQKRAMQMLLTGEPITAATAAEWGLVNEVVAPEDLDQATMALAQRLRRFSPHTIALGKRVFYQQVEQSEADAYELTGGVMSANAADPVAGEGIDAFLAKRAPSWPDLSSPSGR